MNTMNTMNRGRNKYRGAQSSRGYSVIGLAVGVFIASPWHSLAELPTDLTLKQAIEIATENHPLIHTHMAILKVSEAGITEAKRRFKPVFHLRGSYNPGFGGVDDDDDNWGVGIGFSQELDRLFGSNDLDRERARFEHGRNQDELNLVRRKVIDDVRKAYFDFTLAEKTLTLRQHQLTEAKENIEKVKSTFKHADVNFEILIRAHSELNDKQFEELTAEEDFIRAKTALADVLVL